MPECAMFIENECRCDPPPPSLQTVVYLTQHKLHRSKICVFGQKSQQKSQLFRGQKTEIFGFSEKSQHIAPKMPQKALFVCHNKLQETHGFEKLHRRAFTRKRKKKRSREDKKPRAGDNTKAICTFSPTPRARVLFCPFGFFGFLSVARGA